MKTCLVLTPYFALASLIAFSLQWSTIIAGTDGIFEVHTSSPCEKRPSFASKTWETNYFRSYPCNEVPQRYWSFVGCKIRRPLTLHACLHCLSQFNSIGRFIASRVPGRFLSRSTSTRARVRSWESRSRATESRALRRYSSCKEEQISPIVGKIYIRYRC